VPAEIVFSGGERIEVRMTDAQVLMQSLNRVVAGRAQTASGPLPAGWLDVETEDGDVVYVNPAQVAYVRDAAEIPVVEQTEGT
jgi:hypothetical protein